eukprot:2293427-Prorocentrum_lima.AAC.1
MTSSLVGSEMCIRDSYSFSPTRHCDGCRPTHNPPRGTLTRRHRRTAVSYTHLTLPTICSV